jgi:hypothetical protein
MGVVDQPHVGIWHLLASRSFQSSGEADTTFFFSPVLGREGERGLAVAGGPFAHRWRAWLAGHLLCHLFLDGRPACYSTATFYPRDGCCQGGPTVEHRCE